MHIQLLGVVYIQIDLTSTNYICTSTIFKLRDKTHAATPVGWIVDKTSSYSSKYLHWARKCSTWNTNCISKLEDFSSVAISYSDVLFWEQKDPVTLMWLSAISHRRNVVWCFYFFQKNDNRVVESFLLQWQKKNQEIRTRKKTRVKYVHKISVYIFICRWYTAVRGYRSLITAGMASIRSDFTRLCRSCSWGYLMVIAQLRSSRIIDQSMINLECWTIKAEDVWGSDVNH